MAGGVRLLTLVGDDPFFRGHSGRLGSFQCFASINVSIAVVLVVPKPLPLPLSLPGAVIHRVHSVDGAGEAAKVYDTGLLQQGLILIRAAIPQATCQGGGH